MSKNKLVCFGGDLGGQMYEHFHPIINNNSASLEIGNHFCTSVTPLFNNVLFSSQKDLNEQLTCLQIPNSKEDLSNIELAVPPPGDCPLLEALAKDLADPDKGPALNAYLDELLSEGSVRVKAWKFAIEGAAIRVKPEVLEKISIALNRGIKEIPDVVSHANHPNIVTYTVEHIFRGHGANGGRHHISALIADNTRKLTDRLKETADGFYEAVFKNADGTTSTKTFWPDTWDENRIMDELKHVMANNPTNIPGTNNWVGYTTTNQKIIYYVKSSDNSIISAFPDL